MDLIRWGQAYQNKPHDEAYRIDDADPANKRVSLSFRGFGRGWERKSEFAVNVKWSDVQIAIQAFSKMGHPEAVKLRNALDLARAVEEAGWKGDPSASS